MSTPTVRIDQTLRVDAFGCYTKPRPRMYRESELHQNILQKLQAPGLRRFGVAALMSLAVRQLRPAICRYCGAARVGRRFSLIWDPPFGPLRFDFAYPMYAVLIAARDLRRGRCPDSEVRKGWRHVLMRTSESKGHHQLYDAQCGFRI